LFFRALKACFQKRKKNKTLQMSEANEGLFLLVSPLTRITEGNPATPTIKKRNQQLINWLRFFL
jgi:hypothetical protein